jgi:hypothetical protein
MSDSPLWGQAWNLVITSATSNGSRQTTIEYKTWGSEALKITFDVLQAFNTSPLWYADITIYNLNDESIQDLLKNATWATLSAGFMSDFNNGANPVIWDGPVFQVLFTRENVVDQKLTLHCIANPLVMDSIVSFATGPYSSQTDLVAKMAAQISLPPITNQQGTLGALAEKRMSATQYPRGNTVFGKVSKYLSQIADSNFMQTWNDGKQAYISEMSNTDTTPNLVYSPPFPPGYTAQFLDLPSGTKQTLVGTPKQTQQGIVFTVLLDPSLKVQRPPLVVQLAKTQVTQMQRTPLVGEDAATTLPADLKFFVGQVRHIGDSRGNDWLTEVTGFSTLYADTFINQYT